MGVVYQLYHLFKGAGVVKILKKHLAIEWDIIKTVLKIASPGTLQFIIMSCSWIFLGRVMANAFNGAGDTWTPTWVNLAGFWFFQIPLAYFLSTTLNWGPTGVFIAIPVAETAITITAFILFKKGRWKRMMI